MTIYVCASSDPDGRGGTEGGTYAALYAAPILSIMQTGDSLLLFIHSPIHQPDQFQQAPEAHGLFSLQPGHLPLPGSVFLVDDMYNERLSSSYPDTSASGCSKPAFLCLSPLRLYLPANGLPTRSGTEPHKDGWLARP